MKVPVGRPVDLDGVRVTYFSCPALRRIYWLPSMKKSLESKLDYFDMHHLHSVFLWPTAMAARLAHKAKRPYIISPRGMLVHGLIEKKNPIIKTLWLRLIERKSLENANALHVTSALEELEIKKFGWRLPPVYQVPNGVDLVTSGAGEAPAGNGTFEMLKEKKPLILYLGRIHWKKGLDLLIPALRHVPGACLAIAGNDEDAYRGFLERLVSRHQLADRVIFLGPVYGAEKWELYRRADIFVLPSYSENFGNVVLEAMSVGCPVVVTPGVGLADVVRETGSGLVVPAQDRALGQAMVGLLADLATRQRMGENGKKTAQQYHWEGVAKRMRDVYRKLLEK